MGIIGNGTQELESNVIDSDKMDCERSDTDTAEQREATGAQTIEKKIKEIGPNHGEISEDVGAEKGEPGLVNVKIMSAFENSEVALQNGLTNLENISTLPGIDSVYPGDGKLEPLHVDVTNDSGHLNIEDTGSGQSGKRKAKPKGPVTSSWSLRSKSGEKPPKAPEPDDTVKEATVTGEKKRRGRKKKQQQQQNTVSEFAKTKSHLRYLLHRIKYEQNLIDAYSAEGWKGQSLEKLKPEKELQRAKSHILRYKMRIRELFQRLELSLAVGKLPESLFDSLGEIDCEDIFCAKCGSKDLTLDNDIILCDGACERGFHQFCLEPPLLKEHIPPGDEGWLCPECDCKVDCIDMLKDFQGTKVSITDSWEKIFPEAAADASGMKLDGASGSLSDDSEDDDYDPDKHNTDDKVEGDQSSSNESDYFSAPDDSTAPLNNNDKFLGLPSDDSEDDDFDPSAPDQDEDEQVNQDGSSSDFTSDSEDLDALLEDDSGHGEDVARIPPSTGSKEENSTVGRRKGQSLKDELSYLMETSAEPVSGKRHVERMDYKKLHDETFGNSSSDSSDEDFDDTSSNDDTSSCDGTTSCKRRKIDRAKTQAKPPGGRTPIVESNTNTNDENQKEKKHLPRRTRRKGADGGPSESSAKVGSSASSGAKKHKRLGESTTQKLYASFSVNQYPDKAAKEKLAKELGITIRQVAKWFENARWSFNHRPRMESNSTEKLPEPQPIQQTKLEQSGAIRAEAIDENLVANTNSECFGFYGTDDTGYVSNLSCSLLILNDNFCFLISCFLAPYKTRHLGHVL
ncbi:pathogenesis-related homeodomain protein [Phtheirospermum japonicum]|uniref:Pathogenesis-related homeodomain protein n=1 Tax=Phtheirospermum japonicum TaxID=374723 RepID=A0A830BZG0_9LAMI|nr:pathogenesis-related homeodomain protein [Phtheirospermum japonicum]